MLRKLLFFTLCCLPVLVFGQKAITAVKASQAPHIDGNLDDAVWQQVAAVSDWMQYSPSYGSAVSSKTDVRILYDDEAIYV